MKLLSGEISKKVRKVSARSYSRFLLKVGFILLMLGVIAFSVYQLVSHMTVGLDTLRTQEITEEAYVSLDLFVFRDEEVLPSQGNLYQYHVYDGERVGVGDAIATAYNAEEETEELQALLRLYAQRIGMSERLSGNTTPESLQAVKDELDKAYLSLLTSADHGHLGNAAGAAEQVREGLAQYAALIGHAESSAEDVSALKAAMASLVAGYPVSGRMGAARSGYYYYDTDGYELLFDIDKVMSMTPEEFLSLTETPAQSYENGGAGKMVYSSVWYAAAYVSLSDVAKTAFEVGDSYDMICNDGVGSRIKMTVARMEPTADGALLVFKTNAMPDGFGFDRRFSAQTVTDTTSGYRIPTEALVTLTSQNGQAVTGVYILEGNVVEFRKVHILVTRDGYTVAATYEEVQAMLDALSEEEQDKLTADGWSYLELNDKIITRGTGLYEGKIIS